MSKMRSAKDLVDIIRDVRSLSSNKGTDAQTPQHMPTVAAQAEIGDGAIENGSEETIRVPSQQMSLSAAHFFDTQPLNSASVFKVDFDLKSSTKPQPFQSKKASRESPQFNQPMERSASDKESSLTPISPNKTTIGATADERTMKKLRKLEILQIADKETIEV